MCSPPPPHPQAPSRVPPPGKLALLRVAWVLGRALLPKGQKLGLQGLVEDTAQGCAHSQREPHSAMHSHTWSYVCASGDVQAGVHICRCVHVCTENYMCVVATLCGEEPEPCPRPCPVPAQVEDTASCARCMHPSRKSETQRAQGHRPLCPQGADAGRHASLWASEHVL